MEFKETPGVCGIERRFIFPEVSWLDRVKFEEYIKHGKQINPNIDNKIFVGKTIPKCDNWYSHKSDPDSLGNVTQNSTTGQWRLTATTQRHQVEEFTENFLVLCIHDVDQFQWVRTSYINIPRFALRGAITNEYLYIGQTLETASDRLGPTNEFGDSVVYITNTNDSRLVQRQFSGPVPQTFGKVSYNHGLFAPLNDEFRHIRVRTFKILCLKPSPAPLKVLCRTLIRQLAKHSNENIMQINQNIVGELNCIPGDLISYLKYPASLRLGDYMLKGEKIVREDQKYELVIENNGNLVCQSLIPNQNTLRDKELLDLKDTQLKNVIAADIYSIWLYRFQVLFDRLKSNHVRVYYNFPFGDKILDYRVFITTDNDREVPTVDIECRNTS